jgi:uncharacterized protein YdhG (YjbR/CyaY superfamily)
VPDTNDRTSEIERYLAAVPDDQRTALEQLRRTIAAVAPEATETMGYGVPAFHYRGRALVSYGAARTHCAFYVQSPAVMDAHADQLSGFATSKGGVRFQPDHPLPEAVVGSIVRARIAEVEAALARRKR